MAHEWQGQGRCREGSGRSRAWLGVDAELVMSGIAEDWQGLGAMEDSEGRAGRGA